MKVLTLVQRGITLGLLGLTIYTTVGMTRTVYARYRRLQEMPPEDNGKS
jgi:hypothetical protein